MAIITVSRQFYSFGDEIAKKVADDLGYDFIDKEKIGEALAILGLPGSEVERFDEKRPSIWASLAIQHNKFSCLMRAVIYDFAGKNETLILGRGAQVLLKDLPGTLHVRIVAPLEVRLRRIMEHEGYDEKNGERVLRQSDRDSSGYIRSFFNADWNDPDYYDLLINTKTISIDTAVGMIMSAIHSAEFKSDPNERSDKLAALSLQQKAEAAIMEIQRGSNIYVAVTNVDKGVVTLRGTAASATVKEDCGLAISKIEGVREIKNEIVIVKAVYS
jgi:cytidylate kinase